MWTGLSMLYELNNTSWANATYAMSSCVSGPVFISFPRSLITQYSLSNMCLVVQKEWLLCAGIIRLKRLHCGFIAH